MYCSWVKGFLPPMCRHGKGSLWVVTGDCTQPLNACCICGCCKPRGEPRHSFVPARTMSRELCQVIQPGHWLNMLSRRSIRWRLPFCWEFHHTFCHQSHTSNILSVLLAPPRWRCMTFATSKHGSSNEAHLATCVLYCIVLYCIAYVRRGVSLES